MKTEVSQYAEIGFSGNLMNDTHLFRDIFKKDAVLRVKSIKSRLSRKMDFSLVYMDGMVDTEQLNDAVIKPLLVCDARMEGNSVSEYISTQVLFARDVKKITNVADAITAILYGEALLIINGCNEALTIDTKGFRTRGISEPQNEGVLQGPREGFDEVAMLNLAMLRRKLQTPDFCVEYMRIGKKTGTLVFICYLDSLANNKILSELKNRLNKIDIDGVLDSNYIAELIRDSKYSLFKTCGQTERPDVVAARLLEGRIAVVVDGTPVVLTLPYLFSESFQSNEDYYLNFWVGCIGRVLRYFCFFMSFTVPAIFVALSSFHRELLPTSLAIAVAKLRGGVPFSPLSECLIMLFVFEILREAGARMPPNYGHTLSIVGGLVVGQAAVEARIISTPMLIVIAISGISGLMVPRLKAAVFYLRTIFVIISALFGIYGIIIALSVTVMHIISLTSFGVDYTASLRRASFQSLKDTFWRAPWRFMIERPIFNKNLIRKKEETR